MTAAPQPDLTPAQMLQRAEALRGSLRERQERTEAAGRLLDETNDDFIRAGFYRVLQPRRYGGYEFDLQWFMRIMMAVARGCPESAWVLALTSGHAVLTAYLSEEGQREAFGPTGDYRAPGVAAPTSKVERVDGGYMVTGAWDYASGCDHATHLFGAAMIPAFAWLLMKREDFKIVDNWRVFGMQGTGSKRAVAENVFVPDRWVLPVTDEKGKQVGRLPGHAIHTSPIYHGPLIPLLIAELASVAVGCARGALDVYGEILSAKKMNFPPFAGWNLDPGFQHDYGLAQSLIDTAEAALLNLGEQYTEKAAVARDSGDPVSEEDTRRMLMVEQQVVRMAWEAVELTFRTAGTASAKKNATLGRYFRNLAVIRTHVTVQMDRTATNVGRMHFGQPPVGIL